MHHPTLLPRHRRALILSLLLGLLALLMPVASLRAAGILYVISGGAGAQTGVDWINATDLQAALQSAASGDQIWVKAGTYKPTAGSDRSATFQLKSGVALYGGFAGTETSLDQRDPATHISILSGDLLGNDSGAITSNNPTRSDNSYHVVTGSGTDATAVFDGFTIIAGHASGASLLGFGGGMLIQNGSPTVRQSTFSLNYASMGGGMSNFNAAPTGSDLVFTGNRADSGAGIGNYQSSPSLSRITLTDNVTQFNGGGIANFYDSNPTISQITLSGNSSASGGGGMANEYNSSPTLDNVVFTSNSAFYGGGMFNFDRSSPTVRNALFSQNAATNSGGGMFNLNDSHPIIGHTTFRANSALNGGGIYSGGMYSGGILIGSAATIVSSAFLSNTATLAGGGILNEYTSSTIAQSIFSGNSSGTYGSAISNNQSNSTISQVTLSANWSKNNGGALSNQQSSPFIRNSIIWGNQGGQIYNYLTGNAPDVQYTLVQGGYSAGTHILDVDPLFVDADGADNIAGTPDDDPRLQNSSPAINAGNNAFLPSDAIDDNHNADLNEPIPFDLDGNPRLDDMTVDLGAYEVQFHFHITSALPLAGTYGSSYTHAFATSSQTPVTYSVTAGNLPPGIMLDATTGLLSGTPTVAGSYNGITITASNAEGSTNQTFALLIHPAVLTITADNASKIYGAANPTLAASYSGFAGNDTAMVLTGSPSCTTTATTASGVGTYPIHCSPGTLAAANYSFTFVDGVLAVGPAALIITTDDKVKFVGTANPLLTASYSGLVNDDTPASLDTPVTLTTTAGLASPPGSYQIYASGATDANYTISFVSGTLTITNKLVPAINWATPNEITYGTPLGPVQLNASADIPGTWSYAPPIGTILNSSNNQPLHATFTPDDSATYAVVQASVSISVQRAVLTITAGSKSKIYGAANPSPTISYNGFMLNDNEAVLAGNPNCTASATAASSVGIYLIHCTVGTLAARDYSFIFIDGRLSVAPAALTIAADAKTRAFGTPNPPLTASYSGFVNGDTPASLDTPAILTTAATIASPPGSYPITVGGASGSNYAIRFVPATLTISSRHTYLALVGR